MFPFDKGPWHPDNYSPGAIILKLCLAFPLMGIQSFMFGLILLFIDRQDEFQLVRFVLSFKQIQFFTTGLLSAVSAGLMFCKSLLQCCNASCFWLRRDWLRS